MTREYLTLKRANSAPTTSPELPEWGIVHQAERLGLDLEGLGGDLTSADSLLVALDVLEETGRREVVPEGWHAFGSVWAAVGTVEFPRSTTWVQTDSNWFEMLLTEVDDDQDRRLAGQRLLDSMWGHGMAPEQLEPRVDRWAREFVQLAEDNDVDPLTLEFSTRVRTSGDAEVWGTRLEITAESPESNQRFGLNVSLDVGGDGA